MHVHSTCQPEIMTTSAEQGRTQRELKHRGSSTHRWQGLWTHPDILPFASCHQPTLPLAPWEQVVSSEQLPAKNARSYRLICGLCEKFLGHLVVIEWVHCHRPLLGTRTSARASPWSLYQLIFSRSSVCISRRRPWYRSSTPITDLEMACVRQFPSPAERSMWVQCTTQASGVTGHADALKVVWEIVSEPPTIIGCKQWAIGGALVHSVAFLSNNGSASPAVMAQSYWLKC